MLCDNGAAGIVARLYVAKIMLIRQIGQRFKGY